MLPLACKDTQNSDWCLNQSNLLLRVLNVLAIFVELVANFLNGSPSNFSSFSINGIEFSTCCCAQCKSSLSSLLSYYQVSPSIECKNQHTSYQKIVISSLSLHRFWFQISLSFFKRKRIICWSTFVLSLFSFLIFHNIIGNFLDGVYMKRIIIISIHICLCCDKISKIFSDSSFFLGTKFCKKNLFLLFLFQCRLLILWCWFMPQNIVVVNLIIAVEISWL